MARERWCGRLLPNSLRALKILPLEHCDSWAELAMAWGAWHRCWLGYRLGLPDAQAVVVNTRGVGAHASLKASDPEESFAAGKGTGRSCSKTVSLEGRCGSRETPAVLG